MRKRIMSIELAHEMPDGGWRYAVLELPAKDHEICDALQRARITEHEEDHWDFSVLRCETWPDLLRYRLDALVPDELNFFAKRLAGMDAVQRTVFQAVAPGVFGSPEDEPISMKDLINCTYGLEDVLIVANISTDEQLGQFVIEAELNDDVNAVPEQSLYLLDKAMIGRFQRENEGGVFADGYYVVAGTYELPEVYDGIRLPEEGPEQEYVFRLRVTPSEWEETAEAERPAAWINLPIQREAADGIARELGAGRIEDCVCLEFESAIPQITAGQFDGMYEFDQWNCIAEMLSDCSSAEQIKVKAVLSAEKPWEADGIREVLEHLGQYEFEHDADGANDFFKQYLAHYLDDSFDRDWLNPLLSWREGARLLERLGAVNTDYGVVSGRGRSLFEPVRYSTENEMKRKSLEEAPRKNEPEDLAGMTPVM